MTYFVIIHHFTNFRQFFSCVFNHLILSQGVEISISIQNTKTSWTKVPNPTGWITLSDPTGWTKHTNPTGWITHSNPTVSSQYTISNSKIQKLHFLIFKIKKNIFSSHVLKRWYVQTCTRAY